MQVNKCLPPPPQVSLSWFLLQPLIVLVSAVLARLLVAFKLLVALHLRCCIFDPKWEVKGQGVVSPR